MGIGRWILGGNDTLSSYQVQSARAVDILEKYSTESLLVNSSADWGPSDPLPCRNALLIS